MPLDIVTIAPNYSPAAYQDAETGDKITTPSFPVELVEHQFTETADHQMAHYMDGQLRAIVPPEGWDAYAATWPICAAFVAALRRAAQ